MGLNLLGPLELVAGDRRVEIGRPRTRVALAVLALNANRLTSVDQLVDAIWDASPPATARAQVQVCVSALRKVFANSGVPIAIRTQAAGYLLEIDEADLDVVTFDRQVEVAQALADEGLVAGAAETLRGALGLWRGPALAGVRSSLVERRAVALEERRMAAVESLAAHDLELGRHDSIIGDLRSCVAEYPWRERLYVLLALSLYRSGRQAEALEVCRRARTVLAEEHGVDPGAELQALERAILGQDPSLDLEARAVTGAAGPRRGRPGRALVPRQLPAGVADFTGRQEHIAKVAGLLSADRDAAGSTRTPVVAISGPGGVGKSSLAVHIGHEVAADFPDGQLYVDFRGASGRDVTARALAAFLRALGFDESVVPDDVDERAAMYRSRLAGRRLLLVLDGVAHEGQVEQLRPGSNECAVIVTSRSRLGALAGAYHIDLEALDVNQSLELLRSIVGPDRVDAEYEATAALARLCDGLPLALRIAGARLASRPHWSISKLVVRMTDETRRLDELTHHGVQFRSAVATTYQSLEAPTRRLFRLLSLVRAPDFPSWVAAALLDTGRAEGADLLDELVDVQLLTVARPGGADDISSSHRYRFHDLVRMYAAEQLASTDTPAEHDHALRRLLGGWVALVEDMHRVDYGGDFTVIHGDAPRWRPPDGPLVPGAGNPYSVVDVERRAIVAAVRAAAEAGLDDLCWDLALSAIGLFELKGYYGDWHETSTLALAATERAGNRLGQGAMLYSLGDLYLNQQRYDEAVPLLTRALDSFRQDGLSQGTGLVLSRLAFIHGRRGEVEAMLDRYIEAVDAFRAAGDRVGESSVLRSLAKHYMNDGDLTSARRLLTEAQGLLGQTRGRSYAQLLHQFAELYDRGGEFDLARRTRQDVLDRVRDLGDSIGEVHALHALGATYQQMGDVAAAKALFTEARNLAELRGERFIMAWARFALGTIAGDQGEADVAVAELSQADRTFADIGAVPMRARTLLTLAAVHIDGGRSALAVDCIKRAEDLRPALEAGARTKLDTRIQELRRLVDR